MAKMGLKWIIPPDVLATNIEKYGERVIFAVQQVAECAKQMLVDYARSNASWTPRTGNAQASIGLSGPVNKGGRDVPLEMAKDIVTIYLTTGMDYGKWLELAHGGKYAIILPTLESHYNEIMRMLQEIFD